MNNNQNNSNNNLNSGLSFIPPVAGDNNKTNTNASNSVPGANLTPVGGVIPVVNPVGEGIPVVTPIDGASVQNVSLTNPTVNNAVSSTNGELLSVNANSVIPGVSSVGGSVPLVNTPLVNEAPINSSVNLNVDSSSPFDIGFLNTNSGMSSINPLNQTNFTNSAISGTTETNLNSIPSMVMSNVSNNTNNTNNTNSIPLTSTTPNSQGSSDDIVSVGKYLKHIILFAIPVVGFIMLIVKAFSDKKDKNISNFAKAQLLLMVIVIVLTVVISIVFGATIFSMF